MLFQTGTQGGATPLFTNDLVGFIKFVIIMVVPIFGFTLYWLRRGPDDKIKDLGRDLTQLGAKVDEHDKESSKNSTRCDERIGALEGRMIRSETDREQLRDRVSKNEANIQGIHALITSNNSDITNLIVTSSERQMAAVHKLEVQIATLQERTNIGEHFERFGDAISDAIKMAVQTGTGDQRTRDRNSGGG